MTVGVAIIGAGNVAKLHAAAFVGAGARLVAVCDVRPEKASRLAEQHGVEAMTRAADVFARKDVDAVVVAVPNNVHRELAVAALAAGKDVLLEKPMALNVGECDRILTALRGSRRLLQMGFVTRQFAASIAARRLVEEGRLGRVYHAKASLYRRRGIPGLGRWFTTRAESGGGVLIDLGVHLIDLVMHLTGQRDAARVSGACESVFGAPIDGYVFKDMWAGPPEPQGVFDVEDAAFALIRFGGGMTLELNMVWAANLPQGVFKEGVALLGDRGGLFFEHWGDQVTLATEVGGCLADVACQVAVKDPWSEAFGRQAAAFLHSVQTRTPPLASAEHGRTVQSVLDAIYRSSAERREVEVEVA
jgi:predicted dehydrogenase